MMKDKSDDLYSKNDKKCFGLKRSLPDNENRSSNNKTIKRDK
jgi:hypothetical protein